jgi:pyruvate dehydrogenase E2 component (dihydrolipoamide acetyltransferase)
LAVDTPHGLYNPVLRDVANATLADLARQSRQLIEAAQTRRLRPEQMTGSVFSISNLGAFGIDAFTPIINYPEAAVLGLGAIRKELVVTDASDFSVRQMMTLSLTFDHRVVDGAPAARFLQTLVRLMADPPAELAAP